MALNQALVHASVAVQSVRQQLVRQLLLRLFNRTHTPHTQHKGNQKSDPGRGDAQRQALCYDHKRILDQVKDLS
jgi:hypothetical protein